MAVKERLRWLVYKNMNDAVERRCEGAVKGAEGDGREWGWEERVKKKKIKKNVVIQPRLSVGLPHNRPRATLGTCPSVWQPLPSLIWGSSTRNVFIVQGFFFPPAPLNQHSQLGSWPWRKLMSPFFSCCIQ